MEKLFETERVVERIHCNDCGFTRTEGVVTRYCIRCGSANITITLAC